jgi:predicted nucleic-acid-binding protein
LNVRDFAEYTIEWFSFLVLQDIEEFILNGKVTINNEIVIEWLDWLEKNKENFTDDTMNLVRSQLEDDIGGMEIWVSDKAFQDRVLIGFKQYFADNKYFYEMFKSVYITGLKEDGLL